jgi:tetratricopeptide (TPR) repeat protein
MLEVTMLSAKLLKPCIVVAVLALFTPVGAPAQISQKAQSDIAMAEIALAMGKRDPRAALAAIDRYNAVGGVPLPKIQITEARLAHMVRDYMRAIGALEAYLKSASKEDSDYQVAVAMYPVVQPPGTAALEALNDGIQLRQEKNYVKAIEALSSAAELSPGSSSPFRYRGLVYGWDLNEGEKGVADLDVAIRLRPGIAEYWVNRGAILAKQRRYSAALSDYDAAIKLDGKNYNALSESCVLRALTNVELSKGDVHCSRALEINREGGNALFGRGLVYYRQNYVESSIEAFHRSLELWSEWGPEARYALGLAKVRNGDPSGGANDMRAAAEQKPGVASAFATFGLR